MIKPKHLLLTATILFYSLPFSFGQGNGEAIFKQNCTACHSIGHGRLVGPDLANVHQRQSEEWLIKFIQKSQSVVKSGDKYADSLFKAFNQIPMPDQNLSDADVKAVLDFIKAQSSAAGSTATAATPVETVTGDADNGKKLFTGSLRFGNGGPSCISCHSANNRGVITGGVLAKDLSNHYQNLDATAAGATISGMLSGIPAMKMSYGNNPLSAQEVADLGAFLGSKPGEQSAGFSEAGTMFFGGVIGAGILITLFSMFWIRRKNRSVNHRIYERQIKSVH